MNQKEVMMARVYITESSTSYTEILKFLKEEAGIQGVSVFRAISGYGETGEHNASLIDISLDLPLIIEFFDDENKVTAAIRQLSDQKIKPEHIVCWKAYTNA